MDGDHADFWGVMGITAIFAVVMILVIWSVVARSELTDPRHETERVVASNDSVAVWTATSVRGGRTLYRVVSGAHTTSWQEAE